MANILVVDDELGIRDLLSEILNDEGHTVELAENAAQARAARQGARPDLVLLDIWMPDTDGVTLLKEWRGTGLLGGQTFPTAVDLSPQGQQTFDLDKPLRDARDAFEKAYFEFHLAKEGGSMTRVAEKTGLERTHLYRKLKQLGVDLSRGRRSAVVS